MSILKTKYDNGDTNLNKLKFTPNAKRGELPLSVKRIPTGQNPTPPDSSEAKTRTDDLTRIAKLFTRKQGLQFASNNTSLKTAVDLSYTVQGTIKDKLTALQEVSRGSALLDTFKTIGSTLAQIPVTGTGVHFIKGNLFGKPDTSFNKPSRATANRGDQGAVRVKYGRDPYYGKSPSDLGKDKLGMIRPFDSSDKGKDGYKDLDLDDYIKFYFDILNPSQSTSKLIYFRAYLNSFSDNYQGNWDSFNYVGRGESFHTYRGFNRSINVSFKSAVMSKAELAPMYDRLNYLASTTAPTYSSDGIMRGTIVKMNIGDYLADVPGFITSIDYQWNTSYPFEIARGKKDTNAPRDESNTDLKVQEVPHILDCNISFTPIHTFTPQTGAWPYITRADVPGEGEEDSRFFIPPNQRGTVYGGEGEFGVYGTEGDESKLDR